VGGSVYYDVREPSRGFVELLNERVRGGYAEVDALGEKRGNVLVGGISNGNLLALSIGRGDRMGGVWMKIGHQIAK
jgi:hypothetical protein